jgi:hypothetical protein
MQLLMQIGLFRIPSVFGPKRGRKRCQPQRKLQAVNASPEGEDIPAAWMSLRNRAEFPVSVGNAGHTSPLSVCHTRAKMLDPSQKFRRSVFLLIRLCSGTVLALVIRLELDVPA